jgi:methylated-DNA-protein-cysteine methyltransferase related protein
MTKKELILEEVNKIPYGKVSSYGEIGKAIGTTGWAVGIILSGLNDEECNHVAWHRVVAKNGGISALKLGLKGNAQIMILDSEGIEVINNVVPQSYFVNYKEAELLL